MVDHLNGVHRTQLLHAQLRERKVLGPDEPFLVEDPVMTLAEAEFMERIEELLSKWCKIFGKSQGNYLDGVKGYIIVKENQDGSREHVTWCWKFTDGEDPQQQGGALRCPLAPGF